MDRLRQLGYREEVGIPLSLKRTVAEERHLPYFTHGRVTRAGEQITVDLGLYETMRGRVVRQRTFSNSDVFALVDQISVALKEDLEVPQTEQVKDLPVSEVMTSSLLAFRSYVDAVCAISLRDDWRQAAALMQRAVEQDPTFAAAHVTLHNIFLLSNQSEQSLPPLQRAMDHLYRLPERTQYDVKADYCFHEAAFHSRCLSTRSWQTRACRVVIKRRWTRFPASIDRRGAMLVTGFSQIDGELEESERPPTLRWLCWHNYQPFRSAPDLADYEIIDDDAHVEYVSPFDDLGRELVRLIEGRLNARGTVKLRCALACVVPPPSPSRSRFARASSSSAAFESRFPVHQFLRQPIA